MSAIVGFAFLLLTFSIGIFLPFFSFFALRKSGESRLLELEKTSLVLSGFTLISAIFSQICLTYCFLVSDYSVANVYQNFTKFSNH